MVKLKKIKNLTLTFYNLPFLLTVTYLKNKYTIKELLIR
jgi:hypothetical protein